MAKTTGKNSGKLDLDVYTVADVRDRLSLKKETVQAAIRAGALRAVNFGGSAGYRILHADLMQWLETKRLAVAATQPRPAAPATAPAEPAVPAATTAARRGGRRTAPAAAAPAKRSRILLPGGQEGATPPASPKS